jgi:hypothetical protein
VRPSHAERTYQRQRPARVRWILSGCAIRHGLHAPDTRRVHGRDGRRHVVVVAAWTRIERGRYALLRLPDTRIPTEPARPPMIVSECLRRAPGKPEAPTRSAPPAAPSSSDGAGLAGALSSGQRSLSARDEVVMYGLEAYEGLKETRRAAYGSSECRRYCSRMEWMRKLGRARRSGCAEDRVRETTCLLGVANQRHGWLKRTANVPRCNE